MIKAKYVGGISLVMLIIGIFSTFPDFISIYQFFSEEKGKVEVWCVEEKLVTPDSIVRNPPYSIIYNGVKYDENIWEICYILKNSGTKNIIGKGNQTALVSEGLPICKKSIKQIFQISLVDNNVAELKDDILYFKQWLPGECITIKAFVESVGEKPQLYIDQHDIVGAEVIIK